MKSSLLLLLLLLVTEISCFIWDDQKGQGQIMPQEIDMNLDHQERAAKMQDKQAELIRLFRRSANPHGIGYTAALQNDSHRNALVHWTGYPSEFIFIVTRNIAANGIVRESTLWRSTDYGHHFINETSKWSPSTVIQFYYISPLSEYLIFSDRGHRQLWVTTDEGETYVNYSLPFTPLSFRFQSRLAPGSNSSTLSRYVLGYSTDQSLWVSSNLGGNWIRLSSNVTRYYWRTLDSSLENNTTVYYDRAINATHSRLFFSTYPYNSSQEFDTQLQPFLSNSFVLSNEYMFVQMNNTAGSSRRYSSPLWVSRFRRSFKQARFPLLSLEKHYAVVDTSERQVFIGVFHSINSTNLYLSEVEGLNYSLSLMNLVSPPENEWNRGYPKFDVHVVEGIAGTYIANTRYRGTAFGSTVISYDKGGNWVQLNPPAFDINNNPIICQMPTCSLHLHIQKTLYHQSILTQDSAIGLVMAQGNTGSNLNNNPGQAGLYFSRDGGFTWFEVETGYRQFQFAGQGSIVVSVPMRQYTSSVLWSCNEGASWERVPFLTGESDPTRIWVVGMLTESGERALHVTIFGYVGFFVEWLVVDLNFTSVLPDSCTADNYFNWIPTDERPGSRCLLGEVISYERRNSSICCYVDPSYNRVISRDTCNCTQEDFECDFGFERMQLNSPCTPMPEFPWPPLQPQNCPEGSHYDISSGYRKVAGDRCTPGRERYFYPIQRPCVIAPPQGLSLRMNTSTITPNASVIFTLNQILGGKNLSVYRWDFNDSTAPFNVTSYELAHFQVHRFSSPGIYNVTITAFSQEGSSSLVFPVTVLDSVASVRIQLPSILDSKQPVRAGVPLVFTANILTTYGTNQTGQLQYLWQVQPNQTTEDAATVSIDIPSPGTYTVGLLVFHSGTPAIQSKYFTFKAIDVLTSVEVIVPDTPVIGKELTFISRITTKYHTNLTGGLTYNWDFGDGSGNGSRPYSVKYTYIEAGNYTISLVVSNPLSRQTATVYLILQPALSDKEAQKRYTGLGVGLGLGLILVIVIAVVLSIIVYMYRRRYKRLNVRYSRLQQTPVRFTFTQGGEMVEDEDYEGYSDEDEDTADKNSFKIEKS